MIDGPRECKECEFQQTIELMDSIFHPGQPPFMAEYYPFAYGLENISNMLVIREGNRIVSHAAIYPRQIVNSEGNVLKIGCIGGVATRPDARGKGYASILLRQCLEKMKNENYDLSLLWPSSADFYRRLGWEYAGNENCYYLDKGNVCLLPEANCVIQEGTAELSQIDNLYGNHLLRSKRAYHDYAKIFNSRRRLFCKIENGNVDAYVLIGTANRVLEYGGEVYNIAVLLRRIIEDHNVPMLRICTPNNDAFSEYLENLNYPNSAWYLGMITVINENKVPKISCAETSSGKIVKTLFGPEPNLSGMMQIYLWQSEHC